MMNKKFVNILFVSCVISTLSLSVFAKSVGGGEWTVGYINKTTIYSEYSHSTKSHGASTQVWDDNEGNWCTDRICVSRGVVARSEQLDEHRHSENHGHGYWHRCGIEISDCNGASGDFDY